MPSYIIVVDNYRRCGNVGGMDSPHLIIGHEEQPSVGRGEWEAIKLRARYQAAQEVATKLGVSVGRVFVEWRRAEQEQLEWMRTLNALGYKPGEDPLAFLRRVNAADAKPNTDAKP